MFLKKKLHVKLLGNEGEPCLVHQVRQARFPQQVFLTILQVYYVNFVCSSQQLLLWQVFFVDCKVGQNSYHMHF